MTNVPRSSLEHYRRFDLDPHINFYFFLLNKMSPKRSPTVTDLRKKAKAFGITGI
jgi:hypothetical protein